MPRRMQNTLLACWAVILAAALFPAGAQSKHDKSVTNFDGGIFLETDGQLPGGACFRVKGRVDAPEFFENLKREDTSSGWLYRRGSDVITDFPKQLQLSLTIFDMPCVPFTKKSGSPRLYLTDEMIRTLRLAFYWKRGLELRPLEGVVMREFETGPLPQDFFSASQGFPKRYAWLLRFDVPSEGVPLTDSLVLVLRTPDHHIVARTAARL